jgi:hypothetical protein
MQEGKQEKKRKSFWVCTPCSHRQLLLPDDDAPTTSATTAIQPLIVNLPHQVHPLLTASSLDSCPPIQFFAKVAAASKNPSNAASIIGSMFSNSIRWAGHCGQSGVPIDNFLQLHDWLAFADEGHVERDGLRVAQQAKRTVKVLRHLFSINVQHISHRSWGRTKRAGVVAAANSSEKI